MAEIKIGFWFLQLAGYTAYVWSFIINLGDVKSFILFVVAMVFATYKICNAHIDLKKKQLDFEDYKREQKEKRDFKNIKPNEKLNNTG